MLKSCVSCDVMVTSLGVDFPINRELLLISNAPKKNYKGEKKSEASQKKIICEEKNRECERYCSEVKKSKECYFF